MPLFDYRCGDGHVVEEYYPTASHAPEIKPCRTCGQHACRLMALPNMLQYFSESSGRVIQNLNPSRMIHSHAEHQRMMKEKGVEPATQWFSSDFKRTDGLKPGNVYAVKKSL